MYSLKWFIDFIPNLIKNRRQSKQIKVAPGIDISSVAVGQGVTGKIDDEFVAIYNDNGNFVVLRNVCKHLGCQTDWNNEEKTWDCPCHGSRYKFDGSLLRGPARKPLDKLNFAIKNQQIKL